MSGMKVHEKDLMLSVNESVLIYEAYGIAERTFASNGCRRYGGSFIS